MSGIRPETYIPTENSFIRRQKKVLADFEDSQKVGVEAPPAPPQEPNTDAVVPPPEPSGTPSTVTQEVIPQEPVQPPPVSLPQNEELERLKQENQNLQHRLASEEGKLIPTQQLLAAAQTRLKNLEASLEELKTQMNQGGGAHGTQTPDAEDPDIAAFEDTFAEAAPGIKKFIRRELGTVEKKIDPLVESDAKRRQEKAIYDLRQVHLKPVYDKYPNAEEIVRSRDFEDYLLGLTPFASESAKNMMINPENYGINLVMDIFDDYTRSRKPALKSDPKKVPTPPLAPDPGQIATTPRAVPSQVKTSVQPDGPKALTPERLKVLEKALTRDRTLYTAEQLAGFQSELDVGSQAAISMGLGAAPRIGYLR